MHKTKSSLHSPLALKWSHSILLSIHFRNFLNISDTLSVPHTLSLNLLPKRDPFRSPLELALYLPVLTFRLSIPHDLSPGRDSEIVWEMERRSEILCSNSLSRSRSPHVHFCVFSCSAQAREHGEWRERKRWSVQKEESAEMEERY